MPASNHAPDSPGNILCSGDLCIQRTTSIINHKATIKAWADTYDFYGHFELLGPDGHIANCPGGYNELWRAGGTGCNFKNIAEGGGYTIIAWDGSPPVNIGEVQFGV